MAQLGLDCVLHFNSGTYAIPTWGSVDNAKDVKLNLEAGESDASRRASAGWKETLTTLKDASIDVEMVYENGDADYETLRDAFLNGTVLDVAAMDQDIANSGAEGLRMQAKVASLSRDEGLENTVMLSVKLRPTPNADSPPEWMSVA